MNRIENIRSDINKLVNAQSIINQVSALNILFMVNEIFTGESVSVRVNEKDDFEIFKEKSDKEKQETDELENEIRQLLYSLYRSKKLTKQLYKSLVDII